LHIRFFGGFALALDGFGLGGGRPDQRLELAQFPDFAFD